MDYFFNYYVYSDLVLGFIVKFLFSLKLIIVKMLLSSEYIIVAVICYQFLNSNNYCYIFNFFKLNPGSNIISSKCRVLYLYIRGLYNNISDLHIASWKYNIILCLSL